MSADYFTRLEAELAQRARTGSHLAVAPRHPRLGVRRVLTATALVLALAMTLASEFPAAARGRVTPAAAIPVHAVRGA